MRNLKGMLSAAARAPWHCPAAVTDSLWAMRASSWPQGLMLKQRTWRSSCMKSLPLSSRCPLNHQESLETQRLADSPGVVLQGQAAAAAIIANVFSLPPSAAANQIAGKPGGHACGQGRHAV